MGRLERPRVGDKGTIVEKPDPVRPVMMYVERERRWRRGGPVDREGGLRRRSYVHFEERGGRVEGKLATGCRRGRRQATGDSCNNQKERNARALDFYHVVHLASEEHPLDDGRRDGS